MHHTRRFSHIQHNIDSIERSGGTSGPERVEALPNTRQTKRLQTGQSHPPAVTNTYKQQQTRPPHPLWSTKVNYTLLEHVKITLGDFLIVGFPML